MREKKFNLMGLVIVRYGIYNVWQIQLTSKYCTRRKSKEQTQFAEDNFKMIANEQKFWRKQ